MRNALILHGTSATPQSNWFEWLKAKLEAEGYQVWLPQLPGADKPNAAKYNEFLLNSDFNFNEETILIGHSSGAVSILNLLPVLPGSFKIKASFLVAAFTNDLGWESLANLFQKPLDSDRKKSREGLFQQPFDFEKIKSRCRKFIFIHSDTDPYCPIEDTRRLAKNIGGEFLIKKGQGHFNLDTGGPQYKEFPYLLQVINKKTL